MRVEKLLVGTFLLITLGMAALQPFAGSRAVEAYNTENLIQLKAVTANEDAVFREEILLRPLYYRLFRHGNMNLFLFEPPRC